MWGSVKTSLLIATIGYGHFDVIASNDLSTNILIYNFKNTDFFLIRFKWLLIFKYFIVKILFILVIINTITTRNMSNAFLFIIVAKSKSISNPIAFWFLLGVVKEDVSNANVTI